MTTRFYAVLANTLAAALTNNCVWFALTFWLYLETKSVVATSVMAGIYLGTVAFSGFFLGSLVDHHGKKPAMMVSSLCSLGFYLIALILYSANPSSTFSNPASPVLWAFILLGLLGAIAGNIRTIAISTLVTILIDEDQRDKANGLVGTANGVSFLVASLFSGLVIGFLGIFWMLVLALALTGLTIIHLWTISVPEPKIVSTQTSTNHLDIRGTLKSVQQIPGLLALIFFNTFNNFLGGVFMSLMDAYGLSLVSVQVWGFLWGYFKPGFYCRRNHCCPKRTGNQTVANAFSIQYCHVDGLCFLYHSGVHHPAGGRDVYLPVPDSGGGSGRANHHSETDFARAAGAGFLVLPKAWSRQLPRLPPLSLAQLPN
jgi:DHA3 family multidrug efflux protein-like MFS transporter